MRFDNIAKILLIICLGELKHRLLGQIANFVGMYVVVDCVRAQSPTTSITDPPLNRVGDVVRAHSSKLHILGIATPCREYGKHQNATHRSSTRGRTLLTVLSVGQKGSYYTDPCAIFIPVHWPALCTLDDEHGFVVDQIGLAVLPPPLIFFYRVVQ